MRLISELRRRKVFRAVALYAVVSWLIMQVAEVTFEPLHFPAWAMTLLVILVIAGFPITMVLAWFFDLDLHGLRRDRGTRPHASGSNYDASAPPLSRHPSVAVLSFEDMSPNKDQEYLCDGIAEEILNRLARIDNLRVASRTSSFRFKGTQTDVSSIGQQLKVSTVLEGSIRKVGDQLRITTQLVNAENGYQLWSQSYDHKLEKIFQIQDEIAKRAAEALEVTLQSGKAAEHRTTSDVQAYDYYLQGMHYFHRWGLRNIRFAIQMFTKAVRIDPAYARAWAALADSYAITCIHWDASREHFAGADAASMKALALSPDLAEAHLSRGLYHFAYRKSDEAISEFEKARHLNPDSFEAHYFYARTRFQRGELEQAAELFEKAERLRPDDFQAPIFLRQIYRTLGREEDAKAAARRGLERAKQHLDLFPDDIRALNLGCAGLVETGDKDTAMQWAERSLAIDDDNPDTLYNLACCYALMDEPDRAIDCLESAGLRGTSIADWAENDSDLASLRQFPRFHTLMERLKEQRSAGS